jgi:hypothetical protein
MGPKAGAAAAAAPLPLLCWCCQVPLVLFQEPSTDLCYMHQM